MEIRGIFGIMTTVLVLAGVSVAIINGDMTARILTAAGESFGGVVKAATLQKA